MPRNVIRAAFRFDGSGLRAFCCYLVDFRELRRPELCQFPTHSAEESGMNGARKSTQKGKGYRGIVRKKN